MDVKEECAEEVDEEELFVLSGQKAPNRKEQWENIFHIRCTINGRVCSLIIRRKLCKYGFYHFCKEAITQG